MNLNIVIDTREQRPYSFKGYGCTCIRKTLKTGDYSLHGLEGEIVIERKSTADLYGSLSTGRKRFEEEFRRLQFINYPVLLIESSLLNLLNPFTFSKMKPAAVIASITSWSIKYGVFLYFACNRETSEMMVYKILSMYQMNKEKGVI
jgi:ERCC4-type nuclease